MDISVVIPMYNREQTIESAIVSVLKQTVPPMEIIVIDDGSTDKSVQVVRKLYLQNRKVRLLQMKKNRGAQAARNCGIKAARGEWILLLDSDDELVYDALELFEESAGKNPGYDVYYGDYFRRENNKKRYINCRMKGKDGNYFESILFSSKVLFSGPLVKKKALEDIGLLDEAVPAYQEWDTHIRLAQKHKYYYINKPVFIYNIHDGETISKNGIKDIKGFEYIVKKNSSLFLKEGGMKSIIFYYEGMYHRCKRGRSIRQFYYLYILKIMQVVSRCELIQDQCIKIFGSISNRKFLSVSDSVSIFRNV